MASPPATTFPGSGLNFLELPLELRIEIYRLVFPTEDVDLLDMAQDHSYLNVFCTHSQVYEEASSFFYSEATFPIEIDMDEGYFLGEVFRGDRELYLPHKRRFQRIHKFQIDINWNYNSHNGRMGCCGDIEKRAFKMQETIERVRSALVLSLRLKFIEVICYGRSIQPSGSGPDRSLPGPLLTRDLFRPFEILQKRRPTTEIWVTDIEDLTGRRRQSSELECKPLEETVADLAYQSRGCSGPWYSAGMDYSWLPN